MVTIRNAPAHCSLQPMSQATGRPATPPHDCLLGSAGPAADGSWLIRQRCTRHEKRLRQEYHIQRSTCFDAGSGYKGESTHTTLPTAGWSAISEQRAECQKESWPCLQLSTTTWRPSTTESLKAAKKMNYLAGGKSKAVQRKKSNHGNHHCQYEGAALAVGGRRNKTRTIRKLPTRNSWRLEQESHRATTREMVQWGDEVSLLVRYYSPCVYEYTCTLFAKPSVRTIRQWPQVASGWPGFTADVSHNSKEAQLPCKRLAQSCSTGWASGKRVTWKLRQGGSSATSSSGTASSQVMQMICHLQQTHSSSWSLDLRYHEKCPLGTFPMPSSQGWSSKTWCWKPLATCTSAGSLSCVAALGPRQVSHEADVVQAQDKGSLRAELRSDTLGACTLWNTPRLLHSARSRKRNTMNVVMGKLLDCRACERSFDEHYSQTLHLLHSKTFPFRDVGSLQGVLPNLLCFQMAHSKRLWTVWVPCLISFCFCIPAHS